ncbi:MAG: DUF3341 domain-containing protein [Verrucomicrobia bacterium]|nr:DUF3341 domain-containing protein [Verrucomicrobiota bacterium]
MTPDDPSRQPDTARRGHPSAPRQSPFHPATPASYGLLAQFDSAADTLRAAAMVRDAGYRHWDVHTPFPVRGMDAAMGLAPSRVGWWAAAGGALGFALGMWMVWWMNAHDYPIVVGGKPLFSPIPALPVAFELSILLAALGALGGMLWLNRMPRLHHPLFNSDRFKLATHDGFFLVIETADPAFAGDAARQLLRRAGSRHIEEVTD